MFSSRFYGLNPYVPGEQPSDREYIKLNANENPYPPSPAVEKELREFPASALRLYPDPDSTDLRKSIAEMVGGGITPGMVFTGNGSDEILSFIFYTFFDPKLPVVFPEHTYSCRRFFPNQLRSRPEGGFSPPGFYSNRRKPDKSWRYAPKRTRSGLLSLTKPTLISAGKQPCPFWRISPT